MNRVFYMCLDAVLAGIVLIPLFFIFNKRYFHSGMRTAGCLVFSLYLSAVYAVVGLPNVIYVRVDPNVNLVPFAYMFSDYLNSLLNVALFIPLGFLLPILWRDFKPFSKTVLFGFGTSLLIELLQLFTFRATDINDLITNTLGSLLGWCAARVVLKNVPGIRPSWKGNEAFGVCVLTFSVMFFVHPFLSLLFYALV